MDFFNFDMTIEEAQHKYIELSKIYHPDTFQGDIDIFRNIKEEYDEFKAIKKHWQEIKDYIKNEKIDWVGLVKDNSDLIFTLVDKFKKKK